jgi:hypothetical protein
MFLLPIRLFFHYNCFLSKFKEKDKEECHKRLILTILSKRPTIQNRISLQNPELLIIYVDEDNILWF